MSRITKAVECAGKTRVVKELTPREIDALFDQSQAGTSSIVDQMLEVHDLNLVLLAAMVGVEPKDLETELLDTPPSEYGKVIDAAKEVNPDFFAMARQRQKLVGQLEAMERILGLASGKESASSSSADINTPGTTA